MEFKCPLIIKICSERKRAAGYAAHILEVLKKSETFPGRVYRELEIL